MLREEWIRQHLLLCHELFVSRGYTLSIVILQRALGSSRRRCGSQLAIEGLRSIRQDF